MERLYLKNQQRQAKELVILRGELVHEKYKGEINYWINEVNTQILRPIMLKDPLEPHISAIP